MALLKALQSFSREAWVLTRTDAYLLFKTQKNKAATATWWRGGWRDRRAKAPEIAAQNVCVAVALTTTPGLVSALTSILCFFFFFLCSVLVTEEPLKAPASAQLSSLLLYQILGCPLALQTTNACVYGHFATSLRPTLFQSSDLHRQVELFIGINTHNLRMKLQ